MDFDSDFLADSGIVTAAPPAPGFFELMYAEPSAGPVSGATDDEADPRLAAYWLWEYGAAASTAATDLDDYIPSVSGRCAQSLVEGADYLGEAELKRYLAGAVANENWLMRRLK